MLENYYDTIEKSLLCQNLKPCELEDVLMKLNPKIESFKKNSLIRQEGAPILDFGFILSGEVFQLREDSKGQRNIYEILKTGQLFGEIIALVPHRKYWPSNTIAKKDCTVLFISKEEWNKNKLNLGVISNQFLLNYMDIMCRRVESIIMSLRCHKAKTIRQKICTFIYEIYILNNQNLLVLDYTRYELAEFLSLPQPSLSREMSKMRRDGLIDFHKSTIKITNLEALKKYL